MSFGYLSLPIWITMVLSISIILMFVGVKRRSKDRKALIVVYFAVALEGILIVLNRLIDEKLVKLNYLRNSLSYAIIGLFIFIVCNVIYMGVTHKGDQRSRKLIKIGLLIIVFSVVPLAIWIIIDLILQSRL